MSAFKKNDYVILKTTLDTPYSVTGYVERVDQDGTVWWTDEFQTHHLYKSPPADLLHCKKNPCKKGKTENKMSEFKVKDKVRFGRSGGEQTEGIVVKVNTKSLKVQSLETRGRGGRVSAGQVWRVHPSLCTLLERNGKPVSASDRNAARFPNTPLREGYADGLAGDDKVVAEAMAKLTTKEILALGRHFRRGYINSNRF